MILQNKRNSRGVFYIHSGGALLSFIYFILMLLDVYSIVLDEWNITFICLKSEISMTWCTKTKNNHKLNEKRDLLTWMRENPSHSTIRYKQKDMS